MGGKGILVGKDRNRRVTPGVFDGKIFNSQCKGKRRDDRSIDIEALKKRKGRKEKKRSSSSEREGETRMTLRIEKIRASSRTKGAFTKKGILLNKKT